MQCNYVPTICKRIWLHVSSRHDYRLIDLLTVTAGARARSRLVKVKTGTGSINRRPSGTLYMNKGGRGIARFNHLNKILVCLIYLCTLEVHRNIGTAMLNPSVVTHRKMKYLQYLQYSVPPYSR